MNLDTDYESALNRLLSLLNSRSEKKYAPRELRCLFQAPKVADSIKLVASVALKTSECVLGKEELAVSVIRFAGSHFRYETIANSPYEETGSLKSEDDIRYINQPR
jgi:hypothetical protein